MTPPLLLRAQELGRQEQGLAVVATTRADGSVQASVVNAGVLPHPVTGEEVVGFVARGHARKLVHLRARPRATVIFRSGWDWVAVEGQVTIAGPDDAAEGLDGDGVALLRRQVYAAAVGGTADDWAELDEKMDAERHAAVLVRPERLSTNPEER